MDHVNTSYGRIAQMLHWSSALLLLLLWPLGTVMTRLGDGLVKTSLYQAHVGIGLTVLLLTAVRLVWKLSSKSPGTPSGLSRLNKLMCSATHALLYVAIIGLVGSGVGMLLLSGVDLWPWAVAPEQIAEVPALSMHIVMAWVFLVLFLLHVGGIVRYQISKGDTMARMGVKGLRTKESRT